jgi:uncharacterized cupin superfamily protein
MPAIVPPLGEAGQVWQAALPPRQRDSANGSNEYRAPSPSFASECHPATAMTSRPSFIVSARDVPQTTHVYPQSQEPMGPRRRLGSAAGLVRIGVNLQRLPPGTRSSWPHAEEDEEEFVYVIEGEVDAWINGELHRMVAGDLAAFPAGTGICHCFINNGGREALLLVGGEAPKPGSRIFYPLNPSRRADMKPSDWWDDVPQQSLGPHDGLPDRLRSSP